MECIKMPKWSWYHVKTSELEKLSSIIPRDVTSYFSQFVKKISSLVKMDYMFIRYHQVKLVYMVRFI